MDWRRFQGLATEVMSKRFRVRLTEKKVGRVPKAFDMVSARDEVVGEAKYLSLVRRTKTPPAKFMEIAGHVWLLEKLKARKRFIVFGNQREVPERWLKKYGDLVKGIQFYFMDDTGNVERLK